MQTISYRLYLLLHNKGISQKDLALMSGLTESAVSRYIKGDRTPNTNNLIAIANATNVSPNWILGYGPDDPMERLV